MTTPILTGGILMTIRDGSKEIDFVRVESGNTVTADDAAREGFCVPHQHSEAVIEGLLHLAKIRGALA